MRIHIGDKVFDSKDDAKKEIQGVLHRYKPGQELSPEDAEFISEVVLLHPEAEKKIGKGISGIMVHKVSLYKTLGFCIRHPNGAIEPFSFNKCLRPPSQRELALKAMRQLVASQIIGFKNVALEGIWAIYCPLTGEEISEDNCHVDHILPFRSLAADFESGQGVRLEDLETVSGEGPEVNLVDKEIAAKWVEYHSKRAQLRLVSRRGNL